MVKYGFPMGMYLTILTILTINCNRFCLRVYLAVLKKLYSGSVYKLFCKSYKVVVVIVKEIFVNKFSLPLMPF